jgi:hypothetical protein
MATHRMIGQASHVKKIFGCTSECFRDVGGQTGSGGGAFTSSRRTRPHDGIRKYERRLYYDINSVHWTSKMQIKLCMKHQRRKGAREYDGKREVNSA